jgi:peptidoglycan/LPS O-acetylase OafA/YrhL
VAARWPQADILRSLAMLYIVGFWHLFGYSAALACRENWRGTHMATSCSLGMFCFLSGFLAAFKHGTTMTDLGTVRRFYGKRFLRLYPYYAAAVIGGYWLGVYNLTQRSELAASLCLVSMFLGCAPLTFWFVNMILAYYLFTPLVLWKGARGRALCACTAVLLVGLLILGTRYAAVDHRLVQYLPSFGFGLLAGSSATARRWAFSPVAALLSVVGILAIAWVSGSMRSPVTQMIAHTLCPVLLVSPSWIAATWLSRYATIRAASFAIGYLSMSAYLLHRFTYAAWFDLYRPVGVTKSLLYWVGVALPTTCAVAYAVQKVYDACVRLVERIAFGNEEPAAQKVDVKSHR